MRVLVVALLALAVVALGLAGATFALEDDGAPARVSVAGVDVSGRSDQDVRGIVLDRVEEIEREQIVITSPDEPGSELRVRKGSLMSGVDVDVAVAEASRDRGWARGLLARIGIVPRRDVPVEPILDEDRVDAVVARVVAELNDPVGTDARVVRSPDGFVAQEGSPGFGVDPAWLEAQLRELPDEISAPLGPYDPPISAAAAERAADVAEQATAGPVSVTHGPYGFPLGRELLRRAIEFEPAAPDLLVRLDPAVLAERLRPAFGSREVGARDARFQPTSSGLEIVPERTGRRLDIAAIGAAIVQRPAGAKAVRARYEVIRPARRSADLEELDIHDLVGEFTTEFAPGQARVTNIERGAEILDGTIVEPGARLSLNEALGRRTEERGFVQAPQISDGALEDDVGGGVSQLATTLFNAAFFAGLEIVEHRPHEFYISRYPEGRETTISWGGPDVVVVNDWPSPLLIDAQTSDSAITVRMYSNSHGRRVETATGERRDFTDPEIEEVPGEDLAPGERRYVQDPGSQGFTVSYTRRVHEDGEVRRDETFSWTYQPQNGIIEVGGLVPEQSEEADEEPEAE